MNDEAPMNILKKNVEEMVEELIEKAARSGDSGDALRFSQAACNAANAMCSLTVVDERLSET